MKQKKASAELRKKALELFTRGFRFESVAKKLGIDRMVVWRWMSLFDINDLRWLDPSWRRKTSMAERIEIVKDYLEFKSYHVVAKTWGVSPSSVRQYVLNMANYGHPSLRHRVATQDKAMPNRKIKSALMDPDAELPMDLEASGVSRILCRRDILSSLFRGTRIWRAEPNPKIRPSLSSRKWLKKVA